MATHGIDPQARGLANRPNLSAFAGLTGAADKLAYFIGAAAMALADFTSFARTLVAATTVAEFFAALGVNSSRQQIGFFHTLAEAVASTIPAAVLVATTEGYTTPGLGGAAYARTSLATITAGGYPALSYFRSVDRYMPDGSTDATNGGYWLLQDDEPEAYQFGALGTGADDHDAGQAMINYLVAKGGGVGWFLEGYFRTNTGWTVAGSSNITLKGLGPNATSIIVGEGCVGFSFTGAFNRCGVSDMWIGSFSALTAATGIKSLGTSAGTPGNGLNLQNLLIQNLPTPLSLKWTHRIYAENIQIYHSITGGITGNWVVVDECVSSYFKRVIGISTTSVAAGLTFFTLQNDCDTVFLTAVEGVGPFGTNGLTISNPTGATGPRLIRVLNSYFELAAGNGVLVSGGRDVHLQGVHSAVNTGHGFYQTGGTSITYLDCISLQNGTHGMYITGGSYTMVIGQKCSDNSATTANATDGIRVENNVTHVSFVSVISEDYIFSSAHQRYGISISDTGTDYISIDAASVFGGVSGAIGNFSPGLNNSIVKLGDGYTGTLTGCTTSPTATVSFSMDGRFITMSMPALSATSNTTACTITGGPQRMWPVAARTVVTRITDSGTTAFGTATIEVNGTITLATGAAGGAFTSSGIKGVVACTFTYPLG